MTETDPRPRLAAALLERLAPAAEALAAACAGDIDAGPPPEDDRDRADYHRAARAGLAHLRQLLAVIDWSARHLPEPEPEPEQDEVHYLGAVWTGRQDTPGFYAWVKQQDRRERHRRKREKKERRERKAKKKALAARAGGGGDGGSGGGEQDAAAGLHDETMTYHDMLRHSGRGPARRPAEADARAAGRALCAGEARPSGNGASGTMARQGGCDALQTTLGPAQTTGAETGPMTKHDIP